MLLPGPLAWPPGKCKFVWLSLLVAELWCHGCAILLYDSLFGRLRRIQQALVPATIVSCTTLLLSHLLNFLSQILSTSHEGRDSWWLQTTEHKGGMGMGICFSFHLHGGISGVRTIVWLRVSRMMRRFVEALSSLDTPFCGCSQQAHLLS